LKTLDAGRAGGRVLVPPGLSTSLKVLVRALWEAIAPQACAACGGWVESGRGLLCADCAEAIGRMSAAPYCPRCGRTAAAVTIRDGMCRGCRSERHWNTAGIARVGEYRSPLRELNLGLKLHGRERNALVLGELLAQAIVRRGLADRLEALVPVPKHWLKQLQRPCDHAGLLAAAVSQSLGIPVVRAVRRTRYGPSQSRLMSRRQRLLNVRGCFALRRGQAARLAGRTVCIVDNVLVSGATAHEVARVLRRAGAKVFVAVVSRPGAPFDAVCAGSELTAPPQDANQQQAGQWLEGLVDFGGSAQA
jgi:predicted amidophosphoribosyltransferase